MSGIQDFADLSAYVPGLTFNSFTKTRTIPSIRGGVSSITAAGTEQSVGIFVDDVYMGAVNDFDPELFDVERVEILRGPQGTLFGRNVVGGALNIVTRRPTEEFAAKVGLTVGNYGATGVQGYVSGGLSDRTFGSFSFNSRQNDGYSFNRTTGSDIDDTNKISFRARLAMDVSDTMQLEAGLDHLIDKSSVGARKFLGPTPTLPDLAGFVPDTDRDTVDQPAIGSGDMDNKMTGAWLKGTWDLGNMDLVSITSVRKNDTAQPYSDAVGAPIPFIGLGFDYESTQITQELRLVSTNDSKLNWVAGLYYLDSDIDEVELQQATTIPGSIFHDIHVGAFGVDPNVVRSTNATAETHATTESIAVYGQLTYDLTDALRLTLGGRYTKDTKTARITSLSASNTGDPTDDYSIFFYSGDLIANGSDSYDNFTPKLTLDYAPNDNILIYGTVAKGFKSGGFQLLDTVEGTEQGFDAEEAWNYELGLKSRFMDNRVQLNVAVFHVDYTDQQVETTDGSTFVTITGNVGESEINGLELELSAVPVDGLNLWLSATFYDGEYITGDFFSNSRMAFAPDYAVSAGLSFTKETANGGAASFNLSWAFKDDFLLEPRAPDEEGPFLSGFDEQINARLSYTTANGEWEISLWGKNLADERYVVYGQDLWPFAYSDAEVTAEIAAANQPRFSPPRTYGISITKSF